MFRTRALFALIALLSPALAVTHASASPQVFIDVSGGDPAQEVTADGSFLGPSGEGRHFWKYSDVDLVFESGVEVGRIDGWNVSWREDSAGSDLSHSVTLTNTSQTTRVYSTRVVLPVSTLAYSELVASSVGATVTDANGDAVMELSSGGEGFFYQARVNGVPVLSLDPGTPLTLAECAPLASEAGCSATGSDGIGAVSAAGNATEIEIELQFSLNAGDSVGLTSRFELAAEPAGFAQNAGPEPSGDPAGFGSEYAFTSGAASEAGPSVTNLLSVTNRLDFDAVYIVSATLPLDAFDYDSIAASSLGVTLTDTNGDGSMRFGSDGSPIYEARIDNQTKLVLDPGDLFVSDCAATPGQAGCTATASDGVDLFATSGQANEMEISLRFVLSRGDTVAITSRLELLPEPAAVGMLAAGAGLLALLSLLSRKPRNFER